MADYTNNKFEITRLTKSIVKIKTFYDAKLKREDISEMRNVILKLTNGKKYAVLRFADNKFYTSDRIRTMISSNEFSDYRYAIAFVIKSTANRLSALYFIEHHKPVTLSKIFEDENKALEWLKEEEARQFPNEE